MAKPTITSRRNLALTFFLFLSEVSYGSAPDSVYNVDPWIDGAIITGSASTLLAYSNPGLFIHKTCPCDPSSVNSLDRAAIYNNQPWAYDLATATVYASIGLPIILDGLAVGLSQPFLEDAVVFAEVLTVNQAVTTLLKFTIQRPFPHRYAPQNASESGPGDFLAFPSGHTSTVASLLAATAITVHLRYGNRYWKPLPWILAGLLTSVVGLEMYYSGEHFPTDIFAGAILGVGVGLAVPLLHKRSETLKSTSTQTSGLNLLPSPKGLLLSYYLHF